MTCADLTKTTMAGEWRLNPRVLRAKGDRSVLERYLSATMDLGIFKPDVSSGHAAVIILSSTYFVFQNDAIAGKT